MKTVITLEHGYPDRIETSERYHDIVIVDYEHEYCQSKTAKHDSAEQLMSITSHRFTPEGYAVTELRHICPVCKKHTYEDAIDAGRPSYPLTDEQAELISFISADRSTYDITRAWENGNGYKTDGRYMSSEIQAAIEDGSKIAQARVVKEERRQFCEAFEVDERVQHVIFGTAFILALPTEEEERVHINTCHAGSIVDVYVQPCTIVKMEDAITTFNREWKVGDLCTGTGFGICKITELPEYPRKVTVSAKRYAGTGPGVTVGMADVTYYKPVPLK